MSYLSSYTLTETGFSAFRGMQPIANINPSCTIPGNLADAYSCISYSSTASQLRSGFTVSAASSTINMCGFRRIKGLGNAIINNGSGGTVFLNISSVQYLDNIKFHSSGGTFVTFSNAGSSSLLAVYNLGLNGGEGTLTFTAFNNHASLSTITVDYIATNTFYTGSDFRFQNLALTAQSVENILVAADAGVTTGGTGLNLNLSGGTSSGASALTAAAAAARTSLIAKGVSVTLNP